MRNNKIVKWLKELVKPFFCLLFLLFAFAFSLNNLQSAVIASASGEDSISQESNFSSALCQGEERKEYPDIYSLENNSLKAVSASTDIDFKTLAAFGGTAVPDGHDETGIGEYVVQEGDTLGSIAAQFNISLNTLLWANSLTSKSTISPGKKLVILPTTGIMHVVRKGDTISEVAELYKGKVEEIVSFNNLGESGEIFVGDILIIPNGAKPPARSASPVYYTQSVPNSYFIVPVPTPYRITQGLHWYNAIDFSTGKCGSPIFAAAGGQVQRTGYDTRAGRYVRILHPNGVVTFYGHMSSIAASAGQTVSQGQIIGYIGYSGHTIPAGPGGCHLHFDVRGAANPFASY